MTKLIPLILLVTMAGGCATGPTPLYVSSSEVHVAVPDQSWELRFPRQNWTLLQSKRSPDQESYYFWFTDSLSKLNVSFFVEPASKCSSSDACREFSWSDRGPGYGGAEELERFNLNGFSIMKCFVPMTVGETRFKQLNYLAHIVRGGYWINMHLSKAPAEHGDEKILSSFVQSIKLYVR